MIPGTRPPSTDQAAPVTFDAACEHMNTIAAAISSGDPCARAARPARVDAEHFLAGRSGASGDLIRQAALADPQLALDRAWRDRVHEHALSGPRASANTRLSDSNAAFVIE